MSKLTDIENALLAIDQAKFQRLCDNYLFYKGYEDIKTFGTVLGKDKTRKGTPDSYSKDLSGKYVFIEYTTKEKIEGHKSFYEKLESDINECLKEDKTGVKHENLEKIVVCFTSRLSASEDSKLDELCKGKCQLVKIDIDSLKFEILKYPHLGRDYLGIAIDTNQILKPSDFVREYEEGLLSTSLSNPIYFRDKEIASLKTQIERNEIVLVTGPAGVGKTRVALEAMRQFTETNKEFSTFCIANKSLPIYDDAMSYFEHDKNYLVLVDDGNKSTHHLEKLLPIIRNQRVGNIKLILTVRDYAIDTVTTLTSNYNTDSLEVKKLENEQISEIVKNTPFNITNEKFVDRIVKLASGNARLAVMAANIALKEDSLLALNDATEIYDKYFGTILSDLEELNDSNILKAAGIVSFFGVIDKGNSEFNSKIFNVFNISEDEFWEACLKLHEKEVLDMLERQAVKVSDQILSTYFFYRVFIKDELIDYGTLIEHFFKTSKQNLKETLIALASAFGINNISDKLKDKVTSFLSQQKLNGEDLIDFLTIYYPILPDKTLAIIKKFIDDMPEPSNPTYNYNYNGNEYLWPKGVLRLLLNFTHHPSSFHKPAVQLILEYVRKNPEQLPYFHRYAKQSLVYQHDGHYYGYSTQSEFIDAMTSGFKGKYQEFFQELFLNTADAFLKTNYTSSLSEGGNAIRMIQFSIPNSTEILQIRKSIYSNLFELYAKYNHAVLKVLSSAIGLGEHKPNVNIYESDSLEILPFIETNLNNESLEECIYVQEYLQFLKKRKISFNTSIESKFTNTLYELYELVSEDPFIRRENHEDFKKRKRNELESFVKSFGLSDFKRLIDDINQIREAQPDRERYRVDDSLSEILQYLASNNVDLFLPVLEEILKRGNTLNVHFQLPLVRALETLGKEHKKLYSVLISHDYQYKLGWLMSFFEILDEKYCNPFYAKQLLSNFKNVGANNFQYYRLEYIKKYEIYWKPSFLSKFYSLFNPKLKKANQNYITRFSYEMLKEGKRREIRCSFGYKFVSNFHSYFERNFDLLKEVYAVNLYSNAHFDLDGDELVSMLDHEPLYIIDYIKLLNPEKSFGSSTGLHLKVERIWDLENYQLILNKAMDYITSNLPLFSDFEHFMAIFFTNLQEQTRIEKALSFIESRIETNFNNEREMRILFNVISAQLSDKKNHFLSIYLRLNKNVDDFKKLQLYKNSVVSGGFIPVYENRIAYLESLKEMIQSWDDSSEYLEHIAQIDDRIRYLEKDILRERKRDFEESVYN